MYCVINCEGQNIIWPQADIKFRTVVLIFLNVYVYVHVLYACVRACFCHINFAVNITFSGILLKQ